MAKAGAALVLHGLRQDDDALRTQAECRSLGVDCELCCVDLSGPTESAVDELYDRATRLNKNLDLLVNNAGTFQDPPFLEIDYANFEKTMRLNVFAGFFLTQRFARRWVEQKIAGRVLFTGSINGFLAEQDHAAYDASKGAVAAMVRSLCVALAPHGIRVNSIAPGLVRTPLTNKVLDRDEDALRWMELHTPNAQVPNADVCGPPAVFLLCDEAEHVHGQTLLIDGGMSVWQQPDLPASLRGHLS